MHSTNARIFGLDLVRSVAIIFVLMSHSSFFLMKISGIFQGFYIFGMFGVELFFVLSGYLIGSILIRTFEKSANNTSLKVFWFRRWFRTLPNYYLFIFVNLLVVYSLKPDGVNLDRFTSFFFFLQNFAWVKPSFFRVSWSLCVEEWFYLLYPVTVLGCNKLIKLSVRKSFLSTTILFIVFPLLFRAFCAFKNIPFDDLRMIVLSRIDAMMCGVLIAYIKFYLPETYKRFAKFPAIICSLISVLLFSAGFYEGLRETFIYKMLSLDLLTLNLALLLPYSAHLKTTKKNIFFIAIKKISLWSYSLYLLNMPIRYLLEYFQKKYSLSGNFNMLLLTCLFIILSVAGSFLIYNFFEKFFLSIRDRFFADNHKLEVIKETKIENDLQANVII